MPANDRTTVGRGSGEWLTPVWLYEWLHERFAFDYDPFTTNANPLHTLVFSTRDGTWLSDHEPHRVSDRDGLTYPWTDYRAYCNPPYTRGFIEQAVDKMIEERNNASCIVALLPAATETRWFQCLAAVAHLEFLPRRIAFVDPETMKPAHNPPSGMVVAILKQDMPVAGPR